MFRLFYIARRSVTLYGTVNDIFRALPPNKNYEDKYVLGVYRSDNDLAGIVDIVRDFPTDGEWIIGLMLLKADERCNGLGAMVHKALIEWAINLGAKTFRLGVMQDNYKAISFWSRLGYKKIKEVDMEFTAKSHVIDVMRLHLCSGFDFAGK